MVQIKEPLSELLLFEVLDLVECLACLLLERLVGERVEDTVRVFACIHVLSPFLWYLFC